MAGFEPTMWSQTHALDCANTEIGLALALMIPDEFIRCMQLMKSATEWCHVNVTAHVVGNTACNSTIKCMMVQNFDNLPNKLNMLESVYK
jgi:hypothetical protein